MIDNINTNEDLKGDSLRGCFAVHMTIKKQLNTYEIAMIDNTNTNEDLKGDSLRGCFAVHMTIKKQIIYI